MSGTADTIHVLHVDDEPSLSDMVATFLEREDDRIAVQTATKADEGLEILSTNNIDCVVSDYDMPGQNGIEFLKLVREDYPNLPFILYTGKGSEEVAADAISVGVTDYLQKESGTDHYTILANRIKNAVSARQSAAEVKQSRYRLEQILKTVPSCVVQLNFQGHFIFANERAEEVLGLEESDLTDRTYNDPEWEIADLEGDPIPDEKLPFRQVRDSGEPLYGFRHKIKWPDGTQKTLEVNGEPLFDDTGSLDTVIFSLTDITEQWEYEDRLQQTSAWLQALFNNSPDMINVHDMDGNIIDPNPRLCEETGYDESELLDIKIWELDNRIDPEEARALWEDMDAGDQERLEGVYRRRDGSDFPVEVHVRRLNVDGEARFMVISRDITERKEHEQKRQQIIDRMNDAVIEVDSEWRITLVNERTEDFSGLEESELLDRDFWDVFSDALGTHFEDEYRRAMETRELVSIVDFYSGIEEWFDITVYPNSDGGLSFYFRKITEYKERERRLEQYEKIVETMDDIAFVVDDEWNVAFTNESILEYVDIPRNALEDQPLMRLAEEYVVEDDGSTRFEQALKRAFNRENTSDSPERLELTLNTDSEQVSFEYQFSPLVTGGETRAVVVTMRDITERKRHAEQLRALNERSRMLMTAATSEQIAEIGVEAAREVLELDANAIHLYDTEQSGLVPVAATDAVYELVGDLPVFTAGDSIAWRAYEHSEALAFNNIQDHPDIYNRETPIRSELHLPLGDHGILLAGSPIPDAFDEKDLTLGKVLAANIASALDQIAKTDRLRAREAELTRQNNRLEEFASIVSHDLRNPLTVAEGRLELVAEECDSEHLEHIESALDRMDALIEDLLTLASEDESVTDFEQVDLAAITEGCWANVETGDATLATTLDRTILAHESRLKQLFENLVRNAVEHGGDNVTVTIGELDDGFYVEDDGQGISEDERNDVFDAGYSTSEEGTGFGLSIVKQVAEAHDWEICVTEGSEGGARFEIIGVEFAAE